MSRAHKIEKKSDTTVKPRKKTKVMIKYDVGYNNNLYIRGNGPGLSWEHGVLLQNIGPDEWIWEANLSTGCDFKVLINDQQYETGENHHIEDGTLIQYTPQF